ncbi:MAG: VWA domain-containing protein [Bryobacteraceae bacterium]|nr:VWA domain-containing protein [Bryobacteraceae bacterium]
MRACCFFVLLLPAAFAQQPPAPEPPQETDIVFRSDVSLIRVDAQVLRRNGDPVLHLQREDFLLRDNGKVQEIRNFVTEDLPVDVLLLLDVSGSMRTHVESIAAASREAMAVLGQDDRVAIMVFDRATRVRLPFRAGRQDVYREFERLLNQESFNGGTDITRALLDAARFMERSARKEARRAIVILTDDQTEFDRDDFQVGRALERADTVLSAILAPNFMQPRTWFQRPRGGQWPGGWQIPLPIPGGGGRWPGGNGPVILGPRGSRTRSAGTAEIAIASGGDSMNISDASAFETTLARIRQRYALYYQLPAGARAGEPRSVSIQLAAHTRRRLPDAEVRYRRSYNAPADAAPSTEAVEETTVTPAGEQPKASEPAPEETAPSPRRRPAVSEPGAARGPITPGAAQSGGWPRMEEQSGGWRRVTDAPKAEAPKPEPAKKN